ncbi:SRPBCC family protein [Leifsonia poae]|uniref:SRPBCC family protein n=1 Tax=Leifsonia poae TaxID=110933 RepID=UPI001CC04B2A|nr:SRPBCC domain-containing protein [Leifsonia poae]
MTIWGEIALDGARRTVTVEREFAASASELWSALTDPERLARWIGRYEAYEGGYRLRMGGPGVDAIVLGRVIDCEPERRIVIAWQFSRSGENEGETEVEVSVSSVGDDRSRLTLVHRRVQAVTASVYGAGWEDALTHLSREVGDERSSVGELGYVGGAADPAAFDAALDEYRRVEAALVPASTVRVEAGSGVHLERLLDAPMDAVWDVLTTPERIGRWLWPVVSWPDDPVRERPLRMGDMFRLGDANVPDGVHDMEVLALEPGRLISFAWGPDRSAVTIRLSETVEGTLFVLDQEAIPDVFGAGRMRSAPDFAAGWHSLVDGLTLLLNGLSVPETAALWEAAYEVYAEHDAGTGSSTSD